MCIRDRVPALHRPQDAAAGADPLELGQDGLLDEVGEGVDDCLLYTSDAADERSSVDLGGRPIIKKKKSVISARLI